ncbi:MAG: NAD(P)H-dependent oxidoreductase [Bacillota bacterium]|nr:NAD(P)H-dependent oxidoreductase [Bacillota bacterium]
MTVIISDDSAGDWGRLLEEALSRAGTKSRHFAVNTLDIRPCSGCGSCSGKTYGRCIIPDDMQLLLPHIAACRTLVLLSPMVFGGVSHHVKRVMDRMSALGDPRYYLRDGELVKGMTGPGLRYYMVGIGNTSSAAERSAFLSLHEENRRIMDVEGRAFILDDVRDPAAMRQIAGEICCA